MKLPQRLSLHAGFWLVLFLSSFAWAPATYPGYWQALEGFIPVFNVSSPLPLASIATQPDVWRGMGSGTFLIAQPFLLLGLSPVTAIKGSFIVLFLLGGLGCYSWLQAHLSERSAGLAGILYLFAPPLLATVYIRGSLSDATIVMLLPLALAGLAAYAKTQALSAAGIAVIAMLWMWQTQAGLALLATVILIAYVLVVERHPVALLIVFVSGAAGVGSLASVFDVTASSPVQFTDHFLYPFQLVQSQWQLAPSIDGWQDRYPFQLGLPALLYSCFALLGLVGQWHLGADRVTQPASNPVPIEAAPVEPAEMIEAQLQALYDRRVVRLWWFSAVVALGLTLLTLSWSEPLWQWSNGARLLTYPWQLLLLTLPFWAVTAGAAPTFFRLLRQTPAWLVMVAVVLLSSYPYLTAEFTTVEPSTTPVALFGSQDEIVILDVALTENRQPRMTELTVTWQVLQPLPTDYNIFFQGLRGDTQGTAGSAAEALTIVHQLDTQPLPELPATQWQQGYIYQSTYQLDLAEVAADTQLTYYFGYYDWQDGTRLSVNNGVDDKLIFLGQ